MTTIVSKVQEALRQRIDQLTIDNYIEIAKDMEKYFDFLHAYAQLPEPLAFQQIQEVLPSATSIETQLALSIDEDDDEEIEEVKMYRIEKRVKGGFVNEINSYIPEEVIRRHDLKHGDKVYATRMEGFTSSGQPKYLYEVAERCGNDRLCDRVTIEYAIVKWDATLSRHVAEETVDGAKIRIDEMSQTMLLPQDEASFHKLEEGDIVDIAYHKKKSDKVHILWKHPITDEERRKPKNSSYYKQKEKEKREYEQTLSGKTITMIGFEPGYAEFRDQVEARGGELLWSSGKESDIGLMDGVMQNADVVIVMRSFVSHRGSKYAFAFCKENNIRCTDMKTKGYSGFISLCEDLLATEETQFATA